MYLIYTCSLLAKTQSRIRDMKERFHEGLTTVFLVNEYSTYFWYKARDDNSFSVCTLFKVQWRTQVGGHGGLPHPQEAVKLRFSGPLKSDI